MTKLQLLHRALNERLMAAVEQIMEMVGGTVLEYEEETIRARKENEVLRRRLRWMQGANPADWPGPSEPITLSESNPSPQEECAVNFGLGQESEALVIKTETTDHPLYSGTTLPQSLGPGSDIAGTSTGVAYGLADSMTWDSPQSYMAPLDFDPTSGTTRVRHWIGQNRRQRMSFACPDCGKVFGREQSMLVHMRIHSTERPYKYRRRKAFFYGDNKKKKKLHSLSQLSRAIVDDLSDCSEQTNRSSASPEQLAITAPDQEEEPGGLSTESDHTSSDKEPEKRTTTPTPVHHRRKKKGRANQMQCQCPHCPDRVFARPCQLAMHMKTHTVKALVNLPNQAQSGTDEMMDVKIKSPPKKQRKNDAVKKAKVAGKSEIRCPKCDKVFAFASRLRFHMKSHKAKRALLHKTLKMPVQTEPSKEETMEAVPKTTEEQNLPELKKTFACPHCDKVFIREGWLEPHIRSQHSKFKKRYSGQTRSDRLYYQQLRMRKTEKQGVTESSKRKNKKSKKVNAKPRKSSDESNLVVAGYTQQLRKRTTETQGVTKELKHKNEESKKVMDKPSPSSDESNLVEDEAEQSADLPERGTDESNCAPEQPKKDTSDSDRETSITSKLKRMFPCKQTPQGSPNKELRKGKSRGQGPLPCPFCGKVFAWEMRLLMHMRIHCGEKPPYSYRQRKKRFYGDLKRGQLPKFHDEEPPENNSDNSEEYAGEETVNEDGSSHLGSSTTHAVSGDLASSTETTVMEDFTGSLGLLPQTATEQPTTCNKSSQRTKPKLFSDVMSHFSLQPRIVLEPIMTECKYWSLKSGRSERSGFDHKQTSCSVLVDDKMAYAVQDKIVGSDLCIMPVEGSGHGIQNKPEICHSVATDTEMVSIELGSPKCDSQSQVELDNFGGPLAVESSEGTYTESQQKEDRDCYFSGVSEKTVINQVPLIIIDDELEQSNARTASEHAPFECGKMKCDSKCDCTNISAMKLTLMPQTSDLRSLFKETSSGAMQKKTDDSELVCVVLSDVEDNVDEDVLNSSKGLDKKKTASVPSIQKEQLDVGSKPAENPSSDSNSPAPDATESIKTDESTCVHAKCVVGASKHTDVEVVTSERNDQSISNDPLTRDQMTSVTIRQTEYNPMSSMDKICQTSDGVFAGQASLSEVNADKKLLDMEIVSDNERKNEKLCEQPESVLDDSTENSGKNEPSVQNGPECQSNSTDDLFKIHHCCYCKQPHYRMMDHLQSVHPNEPEVAKALSFDKSSQERTHLLNLLQTKGNVLHSTNVVQSSKEDLKPLRMFASDCSYDDSVYCIYCLGLFNKKSFATHLEQCKGKSIDSAEDSFGEILHNDDPVPPTPTLTFPWSPEEIDANLEPSGFRCLNTTCETEQLNLYNEQGSSSHQDVTFSFGQPDISSPNEGVRNDGQTEGAYVHFKHSPKNEVSYVGFKSDYSTNTSTGQESTDCKNEEISLPICDVAQERTMTVTSDTYSMKVHPENDVLRNPRDDFSPPHSNQTVSSDSVKTQTFGTGRKKKKRRSHAQNESLIMDYDLLGEGERPNSKIHVCQHCRATFCSSYTLRRHEYTHTGERPFWCHHCNVGFIQKYRLLKHTFAYHGDTSTSTDQEKLKRSKRRIQGGATSVKDEASLEPSAKSPKDLADAVNDDREEKVAATKQDTEARGFHWEEAGHSKVKHYDTDC